MKLMKSKKSKQIRKEPEKEIKKREKEWQELIQADSKKSQRLRKVK